MINIKFCAYINNFIIISFPIIQVYPNKNLLFMKYANF